MKNSVALAVGEQVVADTLNFNGRVAPPFTFGMLNVLVLALNVVPAGVILVGSIYQSDGQFGACKVKLFAEPAPVFSMLMVMSEPAGQYAIGSGIFNKLILIFGSRISKAMEDEAKRSSGRHFPPFTR